MGSGLSRSIQMWVWPVGRERISFGTSTSMLVSRTLHDMRYHSISVNLSSGLIGEQDSDLLPRCRECYVWTEATLAWLKWKEMIEQSSFVGLGIYQGFWLSFQPTCVKGIEIRQRFAPTSKRTFVRL
jgi:hypothetical protein